MVKSLAAAAGLAALSAIGFVSQASAYTITVSSGPNTLMFDDIAPGSSDFTDYGIMWSGDGQVRNGTNDNQYAAPLNDASNYMAIEGGQTEKAVFGTSQTSLLLYWGSVDADLCPSQSCNNNNIIINNGVEITGQTLYNMGLALGTGNRTSPLNNRWYLITGLPAFTTVSFTSTGDAFEFDMAAIPEASTWAMMLVGFAGLGYAAFRRGAKSRQTVAAI